MDPEGESKRKLATVRTDRSVTGEELEGFGGLCCYANSTRDGGRPSRRPPGINFSQGPGIQDSCFFIDRKA